MRQRLPPALRLREFALLWSAILALRFAENMVAVAVGWQVYAVHRDPLDLGLIGLAEFLPLPLLALPAGQLSDRFPRRLVLAGGLSLNTAVTVLLLVVTLHGATAVWPFFALALATGVANAIGWPAVRSADPGDRAARAAAGGDGAPLGREPDRDRRRPRASAGCIFAVRPELVYGVAVGLFAVAALARLGGCERAPPSRRPRRRSRTSSPGCGFVLRTRMLLGAIGLDLFAVLFGGAVALLPVFARSDPRRRACRARRAAQRARGRGARGGAPALAAPASTAPPGRRCSPSSPSSAPA